MFALYTYIYAIGLGLIFSRNKQTLYQDKLQIMKIQAGAMAHELRTPLGSISLIVQILKMQIPALINGYKQAKKINPELEDIDQDYIEKAPTEIETTIRGAFSIIDILLMNVKGVLDEVPKEACSIRTCIQNCRSSSFPRSCNIHRHIR